MTRVAIDIETVPLAFESSERLQQPPGEEEIKKIALDPINAKVVCIGTLLVDNFSPKHGNAIVSEDEKALLSHFWARLSTNRAKAFIAHNGLGFDLPFLWRRSVINQVRPTIDLDLRKFRSDFLFDTMAVWANWDPRSFVSLDVLGQALGVGQKNGSGQQVLDLWKARNLKAIGEYCLHDCWLTYACYCRMSFTRPVPEGDVSTQVEIL